MRRNQLIHHLEPGFMLAFCILSVGSVDLDVDGLTAPFEFLAAAAWTTGVGVESHSGIHPVESGLLAVFGSQGAQQTRNSRLLPFTLAISRTGGNVGGTAKALFDSFGIVSHASAGEKP
jgi:hypothetical protein